jgi:threonine dehydrogenase-like Zn-dependent dehydrogenase
MSRRALVKNHAGPGGVELKQVSDASAPAADEVQVELIFGGMCHTDIAMIDGHIGPGLGYYPTFPLILGHEMLARVVAAGDNVRHVAVGDRVVSGCHITCRTCRWCTSARSMLCEKRKVVGLEVDGMFAERFNLPGVNVVRVPDEVPDKLAALAEPFAVAAHGVELAKILPGERVAVIGPGSIGQLAVGALTGHDVTVVGRSQDRSQLERCQRFGARQVLTREEVVAGIDGSFDVVLETAGAGAAVSLAVRLAGRGGRVVCLGVPTDDATFSSGQLALSEKTIIGSRAYDLSTWQNVPRMLAAAPRLEEIVSHVLPFEAHKHAVDLIETREASKVLMHF